MTSSVLGTVMIRLLTNERAMPLPVEHGLVVVEREVERDP